MKFYVVKNGVIPGIYKSWAEAEKMVKGFPNAVYKSFTTYSAAEEFISGLQTSIPSSEKEEKEENQGIEIYTDGSSKNYEGGIGICIRWTSDNETLYSERIDHHCTNNKAELLAIYAALLILGDKSPEKEVTLYTDSNYCVSIFNDYIFNWLQNGFITSTGKKVENKLTILAIHCRLQKRPIKIKWIKGHADSKYNILVDQLAEQGRIKKK